MLFTIEHLYNRQTAGWVADAKHACNITYQLEYAHKFTARQVGEYLESVSGPQAFTFHIVPFITS
jgi:hypothetical protein